MASTTRELVWLHNLLGAFHIDSPTSIPLFCDNFAAIQITKNPVFYERTKHIDIDCHIVREKYVAGFVSPTVVPSADQVADFFTKPLYGPRFRNLLCKMALIDLHHLHLEGGVENREFICVNILFLVNVGTRYQNLYFFVDGFCTVRSVSRCVGRIYSPFHIGM